MQYDTVQKKSLFPRSEYPPSDIQNFLKNSNQTQVSTQCVCVRVCVCVFFFNILLQYACSLLISKTLTYFITQPT